MKAPIREIVMVLLLLAMPLGAWWFILRPASRQDAMMRAQIDQKQIKLRELNQATGSIGDLKQEITSLEKGIAYLRAKLPSEQEIDKVLKEVWSLAEANRLTTKSIRTIHRGDGESPFGSDASFSEQPIDVQLEGDFRGFYSFLQSLENQPRIIRVQKMVLQKLDKAPEGHVQANFSMCIFFERDRN